MSLDDSSLVPQSSNELAPTQQAATAAAEIQGAMVVAQRFPRDETAISQRVESACHNPLLAEVAAYSFPRGGTQITGPSVSLARELARLWGNIRFGLDVVSDDSDSRHIRGWAFDLETNTRVQAEDSFAKLIQRKQRGKAVWVTPDERDLRELTNRRGAILVRNCLLQVIPRHLTDLALRECELTLKGRHSKSNEKAVEKMISAFQGMGVNLAELESYTGASPLSAMSSEQFTELRGVWQSIADGNSRKEEYFGAKEVAEETPQMSPEDLTPARSISHLQVRELLAWLPDDAAEEKLRKYVERYHKTTVENLDADKFESVKAWMEANLDG